MLSKQVAQVAGAEDMEASVVGGSAVVEEKMLVVGSWIDAWCDKMDMWHPAKIVKNDKEGRRVLVQFYKLPDSHNVWVLKVLFIRRSLSFEASIHRRNWCRVLNACSYNGGVWWGVNKRVIGIAVCCCAATYVLRVCFESVAGDDRSC